LIVCFELNDIEIYRDGVATERLVGFQDLGGRDDFSTKVLENWLLKKGALLFFNLITFFFDKYAV
jgi:hypothetical protein